MQYRLTTLKPRTCYESGLVILSSIGIGPFRSRRSRRSHAFFWSGQKTVANGLRELLEIYGRGLREPLPFFPSIRMRLSPRRSPPSGQKSPMAKAARTMGGNGWGVEYAERDDPYIALAFKNAEEPLGPAWEHCRCGFSAFARSAGGGRDLRERQKFEPSIRRSPTGTTLIEASAGTGKTYTIAGIVLGWCSRRSAHSTNPGHTYTELHGGTAATERRRLIRDALGRFNWSPA